TNSKPESGRMTETGGPSVSVIAFFCLIEICFGFRASDFGFPSHLGIETPASGGQYVPASSLTSRSPTMWVRQADLDVGGETLPIPSRIASNEEFIPPPQTPQQKEYEARLLALADDAAKDQGLSRRAFLRTGSGMAAARQGPARQPGAAQPRPLRPRNLRRQ